MTDTSISTQDLLHQGDILIEGLLPYSSNYTFLVLVTHEEQTIRAVYKPRRGERPLWDFPQGSLYRREVAAYLFSEVTGFSFVPETVVRVGPLGIGALQLFIDHDPDIHLLTMQHVGGFEQDLLRLAAFDYIINNADRKSGHCLQGHDGRFWAIDHGICFHQDDKLRTVLWDFAGQSLPEEVARSLYQVRTWFEQESSSQYHKVSRLINPAEMYALHERLTHILTTGTYPLPPQQRRYIPWPPV